MEDKEKIKIATDFIKSTVVNLGLNPKEFFMAVNDVFDSHPFGNKTNFGQSDVHFKSIQMGIDWLIKVGKQIESEKK